MLSLLFEQYFYLRQRIPVFLYFFYIHYREKDSPLMEHVISRALILMGLIMTYTFMGLTFRVHFTDLIPFNWSYLGVIHWCIFFFIFYLIANRKGMNCLKSFTLATLGCVGGGWLYEISFFHPQSMFLTRSSIFYINGQIICLVLLFYELRRMQFRANKLVLTTLTTFLIFSAILWVNRGALYLICQNWPMRLGLRVPASLFLLSLLSGIEKGEMKNV